MEREILSLWQLENIYMLTSLIILFNEYVLWNNGPMLNA
jgi:hypothetical protein